MIIAAGVSILAFFGALGDTLASYSPLVAIVLAFVFPPIIAIATRGNYYLRRTDDGITAPMHDELGNPSGETLLCEACDQDFERPDMTASGTGTGYVCSLCLSTDRAGTHVLPEETASP